MEQRELPQRFTVHTLSEADQKDEHGHRSQDRHRNMPRNDFSPQQIDGSHQQQQGRDLTQRTGDRTEKDILIIDRRMRHQLRFDGCQRRRSRKSVGQLSDRTGKSRHLHRVGEQQEHTTHQRRIERILAQPPESHLGNGDRHESADHDDPPGQRRRQVESQQDAGHHGRQVAHRTRPLKQKFLNQVFEQHATGHRNTGHRQGAPAERHHRKHQRGRQRQQNVPHDLLRRFRTMHVRSGCYDQFICHTLSLFSYFLVAWAAARARINAPTSCFPIRIKSSSGISAGQVN